MTQPPPVPEHTGRINPALSTLATVLAAAPNNPAPNNPESVYHNGAGRAGVGASDRGPTLLGD